MTYVVSGEQVWLPELVLHMEPVRCTALRIHRSVPDSLYELHLALTKPGQGVISPHMMIVQKSSVT